MKINVSMKEELIAKLDEFAAKNYQSRSGVITAAVTNYLVTAELAQNPTAYVKTVSKLADALEKATSSKKKD